MRTFLILAVVAGILFAINTASIAVLAWLFGIEGAASLWGISFLTAITVLAVVGMIIL